MVSELFGEVFQELLIMHFACEWCVDQHNIVILECFQSEIDRYFIFIIADILLEEIRTAVDFLSARFENAVRQRNDRILVEINKVFQLLGELF